MLELWRAINAISIHKPLASVEDVSEEQLNQNYVSWLAHRNNLEHKIIERDDGTYTILFHRPGNTRAVQTYIKYEKDPEGGLGLSAYEHRLLGKAFGYTDDEIAWFLGDIREG